jgi:hypothetical protein
VVLLSAARAQGQNGHALEATRLERQEAGRDVVVAPRRPGEHPARDDDGEDDQQADDAEAGHEKTTVLFP